MASSLCGAIGAPWSGQYCVPIQGRDRALAPASARPLLDRHGRRNAENCVDVRTRGGLHELTRIGVERFEVAALSLGEQDVEGERALAAARYAGDDGEALARNLHVDVLQVVLARVVDADGVAALRQGRPLRRFADLALAAGRPAGCGLIASQRRARIRCCACHHVGHGAGDHDVTALVTAFGTEIDDPVRRANHVEVVLDHDQRVSGRQELAECAKESRDVVEMQARRGLVEQKELAAIDAGVGA